MLILVIVTNLVLVLGLAAAVESWMADRRATPASAEAPVTIRVHTWPRRQDAVEVINAAGCPTERVHAPVWGDASALADATESEAQALEAMIVARVEAEGFRVLRERRHRTVFWRGIRLLTVDARTR